MKELRCEDSELSLLLVDDNQIREINRTYLKRDRSTNVISFAMTEGEFGAHQSAAPWGYRPFRRNGTLATQQRNVSISWMKWSFFSSTASSISSDMNMKTPRRRSEKMKKRERELFSLLRHYQSGLKISLLFDHDHLPGIDVVLSASFVQLTQLIERHVVLAGDLVESCRLF